MAISRTLLKSNLLLFNHPAKAIARLNDQLASENEQMMFVTCFCGVLNLTSGELNYVNAGHNPPIVFSEQKARYLSCEKNIALAVAEGFDYVEESLLLKPNDIFLLYTDGVTEAIDIDGQFFGEPRLLETMSSSRVAVHELPKHIVTCIKAFERGAKQADDITCVALQYIGQDVTE